MIREGSDVKWEWGNGEARGTVEKTHDNEVSYTIKGNTVTRKGEPGNKALYIKQSDGDYVLKSESEVERVN